MAWVFDHIEREVVTKDELSRREAGRNKPRGKANLSFIPDRPIRGSWIYDRELKKVVSSHEYYGRNPPIERGQAPMVIGPLQDYISAHDGSVIKGRTAHREHLKKHGLYELGNEKPAPMKTPKMAPVEADIKEAIAQLEAGIPAAQIDRVGSLAKQSDDLKDI